jgi:hypothetical protein
MFIKIKLNIKFMKIEIGNRVTSTEVAMNKFGCISQSKHLEVVEFCSDGKVRCKYFSEAAIYPKPEYFLVKLDSLKFVNNIALKYRGIGEDPYFNQNYLDVNNYKF